MQTLIEAVERGLACLRDGDLGQAESIFDQLLCQIDKPDINVIMGYGTTLLAQQRYGLGTVLLQTALSMRQDIPQLWTNYACALKFLGRDEQSLAAYQRSMDLEPNAPDTLAGIAGFWINKAEPGKVVDYARQALASDPNHHAAHMHLALGLLEQGRFDEAWSHYEHRWETLERLKDQRPYAAPRWTGEHVRTLAIHGEQGLGDEIMFMAAFERAKSRADRIVIECASRLIPLFERSFEVPCYPDHASLIEAEGEPDACIAMGSLWGVVGTPVDAKPYLKRETTTSWPGRVGIAWKGGTIKTSGKERTLSLEDFKPILAVQGVEFVSVQYGDDSECEAYAIKPLVAKDFDAIQGRIEQCDLVITVCQTAVHQAGGLGVPCWVLTPRKAAWRYCGETMPWYPSVEMFRQSPEETDWHYIIQNVANALRERYAKAA